MARTPKLRTPDLVWLFETTHMTIYNWRHGAPRKTRPLPCDIDPLGNVSFRAGAVKSWAKENGLELRMDPAEYLAQLKAGKSPKRKPGPKPRTGAPATTREPKPKAAALRKEVAAKAMRALYKGRNGPAARAEFDKALAASLRK